MPDTVRGLMERLAKLAGSSFRTLQKYKALWHPDHRSSESLVTPQPVSFSAIAPIASPPPLKSSNPEKSRVLPTPQKIMKCEGVSLAVPTARIEEKTKNRGVRGDASRFPQAFCHDSPDSVIHLQEYQPLPALLPTAAPEERSAQEMREAYRQCVFQLRWSKPQRDAYIAEQFGGKRFYQLTTDEMTLLLYRLRRLLMDDSDELL